MKMLDEKEWKDVELGQIANISSGRDIYAQERISGDTPYITSGTANNGIGYFVGNVNDSKAKNAISVNRNGAVGEAFYHPYNALYGNDCRRVNMKDVDDADTQLFTAECISEQKKAFSYSRKLGTARLKRLHVMLPVDDNGKPDYDYMAQYASEMRKGMLMRYRKYVARQLSQLEYKDIPELNEKAWNEYSLEKIFSVGSGKRLTNAYKIDGDRPFIGATDNNNGVTGFVGNSNSSLDKNVLGVNYNGAPCIAFYHPYECIFTDDVKRLHLRYHDDNKYVLLFFKAIIMQQRKKYGYGYKFKEKRMLRQKLILPVNAAGEPDYEYMEQYAKNMMLKKYRQYLEYLEGQH